MSVDTVNNKLSAFLSSAYDLLVDENGQMDHIKGFASGAHQALSGILAEISYISPSFSDNSHSNCFPVRKWQKEVNSLYGQIAKIERFVSKM